VSDYGLNFGFLRSDESSRSAAEGRYRTPKGSALLLGTMVEIDGANPGYLKQSAANAAPVTGFRGLLLQELDFERSIYESGPDAIDSFQKGVAKPNRLAVITSGAGTKVWFRNTNAISRVDGREIAARTMVALIGAVAVGDTLGWDGTKWARGRNQPALPGHRIRLPRRRPSSSAFCQVREVSET
jgi:hypothetical protein